jgi:hypothetical protein
MNKKVCEKYPGIATAAAATGLAGGTCREE